MNDSLKQSQQTGDHSTNIQAQTVEIHHHGLTVPEVRKEFMALFEANFYRLQSVARETAEQRAKEVTEKFLGELAARNPAGLLAARDPDMQAAVFTAQREYARSGGEDLEQVLVELLVQRATAKDLPRIVLNEAIAVASKLTEIQLDTLSLLLVFVHDAPIRRVFESWSDLGHYLNGFIGPVIPATADDPGDLMHLKYTGCISTDLGGKKLSYRIVQAFAKNARLNTAWRDVGDTSFLAQLCELEPRLGAIRRAYEKGRLPIDGIQLTTVGIALANANLRRKTGLEFDLGTWIG